MTESNKDDYAELRQAITDIQDDVKGLTAIIRNNEGFNIDNYQAIKLLLEVVEGIYGTMEDIGDISTFAKRIHVKDKAETLKMIQKTLDRRTR